MRLLALETSAHHGSVAIWEDDCPVASERLAGPQRTAQSLLPAVERLLRQVAWKPRDLELIAVTVGPGSYTGLRVGVTVAKTLAYAVNASVIGLDTLRVVAAQLPQTEVLVCPVLDAYRRQVYVAEFRLQERGWPERTEPTRIENAEEWLAGCQTNRIYTGDGLKRLAQRLPSGTRQAPPEFWTPLADTVAQLAWRDHLAGRRDDFWRLVPQYYRASAAEEKAAGRSRAT